jgi:PAS domain S-box-containing protein
MNDQQLYQLIRLMGDTMPDMMWAKDLQKRYIFANKAICRNLLHARDTSEPIGKTDLFFAERERALRPDDPNWHTFGELCMDSDELVVREMKKMQFDEYGNVRGKFLFLDVHKAPLFDSEGNLIGIVGSARDITERKQTENTIFMLAHAVRSVSECVSITDMSDNILFVNSAFLKTYQYKEEELIGKPISMVRSPKNNMEFVKEILPSTFRGGWHGELINVRKDGSEFPVHVSTSVIHDENGKPLALIGVTTDITARKKAEMELHDSETRNKALLSAIPDLMFMFNKEGVFLDYHARDPSLLMRPPEEFIGRTISEVLPEDIATLSMEKLALVFKEKKMAVYEYPIKIGDETLFFESRIALCGNDTALSIVRDISDQKKIESQIIQSERLTALGEMSAGMAHEINQPLNTLSILFDNILLEARENHLVTEEYLVSKSEKIFNNILRIKNLIDHVRDFSRSRESFILTPFNINDSISNALSMVSEQFKIKGIQPVTDLDPELPAIKGNTYRFEQVVLNLILNSKDALLEKKDALQELFEMNLKVTSSRKGENIFVIIEDNGMGIREDQMNKIFQPFYTTKEIGKGTGLGLSISYGIIREMNGKLEVQSKFRKGTSVRITIPCKPLLNSKQAD